MREEVGKETKAERRVVFEHPSASHCIAGEELSIVTTCFISSHLTTSDSTAIEQTT